MNSSLRIWSWRRPLEAIAVAASLLMAPLAAGEVLLEETWADGSRAEQGPPQQAAVWAGREGEVSTKPGALATTMGDSSQKIWTYFTGKEPVKLAVGQKLSASVSFIPRGQLSETSSRSLRIGLFHDPSDPRVEQDVNSDAGGDHAPWRDATGYAVQVLVSGDQYTRTKPFDLGKRINLESDSLLGTSADYAKASGGSPVGLQSGKTYTVVLEVERVSEAEVELTASYRQDGEVLTEWTVYDDGSYLGTEGVYDTFDMLFIRIANRETTSEAIEYTNFKVELTAGKAKQQSAGADGG